MSYEIKDSNVELNLAPLIDVVFLLLIFFIVTSTLNSQQVKKDIQLPTTEVAEEKNTTELDIQVTHQGQLYLGEKEVSWDNLQSHLAQQLAEEKKTEITIAADEQVEFQQIVRLMDFTKQLEVENLSFLINQDSN